MRGRGTTLAVGGMATALIVMGCSTAADGTPVPATTTSTVDRSPTPSGTSSTTRYGAPKVTRPLDVSTYLTQPCTTLGPAQLTELSLPAPGKPDTDSALAKNVGPLCTWTNSAAGNTVGVGFISGNPNGLDDLYRGHEQGQFDGYWTETTIEDFPAVFLDATDGRRSGRCGLAVGISDTLVVRISEHGQLKEKSCDRAKLIASAVVQTLKGGR
jgi:hypothetical protein